MGCCPSRIWSVQPSVQIGIFKGDICRVMRSLSFGRESLLKAKCPTSTARGDIFYRNLPYFGAYLLLSISCRSISMWKCHKDQMLQCSCSQVISQMEQLQRRQRTNSQHFDAKHHGNTYSRHKRVISVSSTIFCGLYASADGPEAIYTVYFLWWWASVSPSIPAVRVYRSRIMHLLITRVCLRTPVGP